MTDSTSLDAEPTTPDEFETLLGELLAAAVENGVDPRGSWVYRDGAVPQEWELMVEELEPRDADGDESGN